MNKKLKEKVSNKNQKPIVFIITIDEDDIKRAFTNHHHVQKPEISSLGIAQALAASPIWRKTNDAVIVARNFPNPVLGIFGHFDKSTEKRFRTLRIQLQDTLECLRYIGYSQAENDCEQLAEKLIERFGMNALRQFNFVPIPRGGFFVLGMLSYILELNLTQMENPHRLDIPMVVVDDCALSGANFARFLTHYKNRQIIFAHLYSHPALRSAIEGRESQVLGCISAKDIHSDMPLRLGEKYSAWKDYWLERLDGQRYWIGNTERICFAWNEPDFTFFNPVTERFETGFRIVPPDICLKNRSAIEDKFNRLQVQPEGKGPLKPSDRVIFGMLEEKIIVADIEKDESFVLEGAAADIWKAIIDHGNVSDIMTALSKQYNVDKSSLRTDLHNFVDDLLDRGLLEDK